MCTVWQTVYLDQNSLVHSLPAIINTTTDDSVGVPLKEPYWSMSSFMWAYNDPSTSQCNKRRIVVISNIAMLVLSWNKCPLCKVPTLHEISWPSSWLVQPIFCTAHTQRHTALLSTLDSLRLLLVNTSCTLSTTMELRIASFLQSSLQFRFSLLLGFSFIPVHNRFQLVRLTMLPLLNNDCQPGEPWQLSKISLLVLVILEIDLQRHPVHLCYKDTSSTSPASLTTCMDSV